MHSITIPGTPVADEPPRPAALLPVAPMLLEEPQALADQNVTDYQEREPNPPVTDLYPSYARPRGRTAGPANRIVAGIGAGLLFVGLFMPMIHGPLGVWMSFIDVPWKAVTVGFFVADEVSKSQPEPSRPKSTPPPKSSQQAADPKAAKDAGKGALFFLVAAGSVVYPLLVLAAVGYSAIQIATGRQCRGFVYAGGACGIATAMYAVGILLLNSIEELRAAMLLTSPGFGWAVMFIGSVMLIIGGLIRRPA